MKKGRPKSKEETKIIKSYCIHQSLFEEVFQKYPEMNVSQEIEKMFKVKLGENHE